MATTIEVPELLYILTARDAARDKHVTLVRYHVAVTSKHASVVRATDADVAKAFDSICHTAESGQVGMSGANLPPFASWKITPGSELVRLDADDGTGTYVVADCVTGFATTGKIARLSESLRDMSRWHNEKVNDVRVEPAHLHMTRSRHDTKEEADHEIAETLSTGVTQQFYGPLRLERWEPKA